MPKVYHQPNELAGFRERIYVLDARIRQDDYPSFKALAKHCCVSTKTIQRDLEYMRDFMYAPLEYDKSQKGWCYADKTFALPAQYGSKHDMLALLVLGEAIAQYAGTPFGASLKEAYNRILQLYKNEETPAFKRLARKIRFAKLPGAPISSEVWQSILTSLQFNQRLNLAYAKGGHHSVVHRQFDPFGLIVRDRDWFLIGYCHFRKKLLTFSVPLIQSATAIDEYFELPSDFDLDQYVQSGFQALHTDSRPAQSVVLRFAPAVADIVAMRPLANNQKIEHDKGGYLIVSFKASALFQVEREVLCWGDQVEVIAPPELRERIKRVGEYLSAAHQ